jgi:hypothetical protein
LFADFFHIAIHRKHTIQFNDKFKNRLTLIKSFAFAFLPKGLIQYTRTPSRRQIRPPQLLFYEFTIDLTSTLSYQSQDKAEVRTRVSGFAKKTLSLCNSTFMASVIWNYFKTVLIRKICNMIFWSLCAFIWSKILKKCCYKWQVVFCNLS